MTKPIDIVRGNIFTLRTHMSVLDKDIEGYVSLDMSSARDEVAMLEPLFKEG